MEKPDKTEEGNKNKYDTVESVGHTHPEPGQGVKEIAEKEKKVKKGKEIRNPVVKEQESQGGVSDSLKGGER